MQSFCEDGNEFHVGHTEFDLMKRNIDPYYQAGRQLENRAKELF